MSAHRSGAANPVLHLADSILYVSALLRDRPRRIDDCIDYFGNARRLTARGPGPAEYGSRVAGSYGE
jgi:hypothetical protein